MMANVNKIGAISLIVLVKISLIVVIVYELRVEDTLISRCGNTNYTKMESFYVTLPSNLNTGFNENKIGNYTTRLPRKIHFPMDEHWEVGLAEISYPKSWYNILKPQQINIFTASTARAYKSETGYENSPTAVPPGHYESPFDIIRAVNNIFKRYDPTFTKLPKLEYSGVDRKMLLTFGKNSADEMVFVDFGPDLNDMLGFQSPSNETLLSMLKAQGLQHPIVSEAYKYEHIWAFKPIDLYAGYQTLFAYSDICAYSPVGDRVAQLLRMISVPHSAKFGQQIVLTYPQPFYVPIGRHEFQSIDIDISQEQGRVVDFTIGKVVVVLHFRRLNGLQ